MKGRRGCVRQRRKRNPHQLAEAGRLIGRTRLPALALGAAARQRERRDREHGRNEARRGAPVDRRHV